MSSLATVALRGARSARIAPRGVRHITAGPNWHIPFNFTTTTRRALAFKMAAYMGTGFAVPWIAVWWGWNRPGGLNNSGSSA